MVLAGDDEVGEVTAESVSTFASKRLIVLCFASECVLFSSALSLQKAPLPVE